MRNIIFIADPSIDNRPASLPPPSSPVTGNDWKLSSVGLAHCNKCRPAEWDLRRVLPRHCALAGVGWGLYFFSSQFESQAIFGRASGLGPWPEELWCGTSVQCNPCYFISLSPLSIQESRADGGSELTLNKNINWFIIQNKKIPNME